MALNWTGNDYFSMLIHRDKRSYTALEMLVDDLHSDKERTINKFLTHSGSEDFLWGLVKLLGNNNPRVAGNSAYIIGTLAESEIGSMRIIGLTSAKHADSKQILPDLTNMLRFNDSESVMNAAGTMGTLAESHGGRKWMLQEACLCRTIEYITNLLHSDNIWTASNAALVLARLTIAEEGCEQILKHDLSDSILTQLIASLGVDEAGRGMNAAFAIGRLCDLEIGRTRLLTVPDSEKMISALARMLCCSDPGASKNACFALSCLATNREGHNRLLCNNQSEEVLRVLAELLSSQDNETGWFAAMTLHTLASQPRGCLRLRENATVLPSLKAIEAHSDINDDLAEEVSQTIEILKRLEKPVTPTVRVNGCSQVELSWCPLTTKSGFTIKYHLFENSMCVWSGKETTCTRGGLAPHTQYIYRIRGSTEGDEGPLSDPVTVTTEETVPGPPTQLRILACTTTQLKVGWESPDELYGTLRGYYVYNGDKVVEHTAEHSAIISGLTPSTSYEIQVCASSCKGKGPRESVTGITAEMGAHAPSKPDVTVRGRNEMHISWRSPVVPLGRMFRYDVLVNGDVVYSGTDLHCVVRRLRADTEYSISICAVTSEGKCESKTVKKKTAKDEFEGERAPLYVSPVKAESEKKPERPKSSSKKRKSLGGSTSQAPPQETQKSSLARVNSASLNAQVKRKAKGSLPPLVRLTYSHGVQKEKDNVEVVPARPTRRTPSQPREPTPETSDAQHKKNTAERRISLPTCQAWDFSKPYTRDESKRTHITAASKTPKPKPLQSSDDLSKPQDTDIPRPRPPKPRSGNRRISSTKSAVRMHDVDHTDTRPHKHPTPPGDSVKSKSHDLTINSDAKVCGHWRRASHPHARSPDSRTKSGGSHRDSLQNTTLSASMPEGFVDVSIEELPMVRNGKHESDITWIAHSKRAEFQESITRLYSGGSITGQNKHGQTLKPGLVEFEGRTDLIHSKSPCGPTNYVQRASTFISSHRPAAKKQLDKIQIRVPNFSQLAPQWQPELSLPSSISVRNHNKFVPMQFRTQPNNLPGVISRQNTTVQAEKNIGLEILSRSHTETSIRQTDHGPHTAESQRTTPGPIQDGSREHSPGGSTSNPPGNVKDRNVVSASTKSKTASEHRAPSPSTQPRKNTVMQNAGGAPSGESLLLGLGVSSHDNSAMQSAR